MTSLTINKIRNKKLLFTFRLTQKKKNKPKKVENDSLKNYNKRFKNGYSVSKRILKHFRIL